MHQPGALPKTEIELHTRKTPGRRRGAATPAGLRGGVIEQTHHRVLYGPVTASVMVTVRQIFRVGLVTERFGNSLAILKAVDHARVDDTIDRDTANVESEAGFVKALKAHKHQIDVMKANLPSGSVGKDAKKLLNTAKSVIAGGNPNQFFAAAGNNSGAIDTYCGVQENGTPLPAYFKQGTKTSFCKTFLPAYEAVSNATSDATTLSAVTSHQTQINQLASELSTLPKSIKTQATDLIQTAQSAITANSATPIANDTSDNHAGRWSCPRRLDDLTGLREFGRSHWRAGTLDMTALYVEIDLETIQIRMGVNASLWHVAYAENDVTRRGLFLS
jgi:hypothetical protein